MIDPTQILIFAVIIILTILMVIIGWQIYLILSEIRKTLVKMNTMVDNTVYFTENIGRSILNLTGFSEGIKAILGLIKMFSKKNKEKNG